MKYRIGTNIFTEYDVEIIVSYFKDFLKIQEEKNNTDEFSAIELIHLLRSEQKAYDNLKDCDKKVVDKYKKSIRNYSESGAISMCYTLFASGLAFATLYTGFPVWLLGIEAFIVSFMFALDIEYLLSHKKLKKLRERVETSVFLLTGKTL